MSVFSDNLQTRLRQLRISSAEGARMCGLGEKTFNNYVIDQRKPSPAVISRISHGLATSPNILLGFEDGTNSASIERLTAACRRLDKNEVDNLAITAETILLGKLGQV